MSEATRTRRVIALIAAYVVALQALLLPLSVAAGSPFQTSLCAAVTSAEGTTGPASYGGCPCAAGCGMQCCAQGLAGPPQVIVAYLPARVFIIAPPPAGDPVMRPADRQPQIPRAPPAV